MRLAGAPVPALADDIAVLNQNRSAHRIGRSISVTARGQAQGQVHPKEVLR